MRIVDVGCGTGRHLLHLNDRVRFGAGIDYERTYIAAAARQSRGSRVHFITADATALPLSAGFDLAMCLTNTWGTMTDKRGVLSEMRRVAPQPHTRLLSVYSETSVMPRREWYRRLGQPVHEETPEYLASDGGFRSEHFTEARIRDIVGECTVRPLSRIAYAVMF
jgi:ubiquinone/menaquinone biosynthesis C-methylase UbiE